MGGVDEPGVLVQEEVDQGGQADQGVGPWRSPGIGSTFRSLIMIILQISIFTENIRLFVFRCEGQFMRSSTTSPQEENTTTAQITTLATTIRYITINDPCSLRENSLSI